MIPTMKAAPIVFFCCLFALPLFAQSDQSTPGTQDQENGSVESPQQQDSTLSPHCHLQAPRPFGIAGIGIGIEPAERARIRAEGIQNGPRPVTDEQLYSRYFRYVAGWDVCLASGVSPDSLADRFPDPYPGSMNENQRGVVTLVANDWLQSWHDSMQTSPPLTVGMMGPPATWAQVQELKERRQHLDDLIDQRAKVMESRLQSLRLALGKATFAGFDDYVHGLYQTIPGRLVRQPLSEGGMIARYFSLIASMDKFAAGSGDDAQAAAKARSDEQSACGLSDKEQSVLQEEADSFQRDIRSHQQERAIPNSGEMRSVPAIRPREREQIADSHVEHLRSSLSNAAFEKVEKRAQELYQGEGPKRTIPATDPDPKPPEPKAANPS
jgi:hypothetical protein